MSPFSSLCNLKGFAVPQPRGFLVCYLDIALFLCYHGSRKALLSQSYFIRVNLIKKLVYWLSMGNRISEALGFRHHPFSLLYCSRRKLLQGSIRMPFDNLFDLLGVIRYYLSRVEM
ncbi:hypothetical protein NPIL_443121 [Nephila pilipes]|uniref:Uncharacterized protein n=1 Tax=Nephila pilipes TaxID=299642 RepID=A0A8X6NNM1_NEPPI|nr:hypothetical protein NPIL_443121 [Nephila pilipes]